MEFDDESVLHWPANAADSRDFVKQVLATKINRIIDARGLSQVEAGQILGMPQPKISAIRNYKLRGISFERLLQALADLGQHIDIIVSPSTPAVPEGIRVPA